MKVNASPELKSRLHNAAANGSIIARDLIGELRNGLEAAEILRGATNYLSTKRIVSRQSECTKMKIIFTACTKDINHPNFPDRNNPNAPWFPENRSDLEPGKFLECFKRLGDYEQADMDYFVSAICVDSKVNVKVYSSMNDIFNAYNVNNYSPFAQNSQPSLHNSCMRDEVSARDSSDFYHNFAGAKIIVAKDEANNILGRAILWDNAETSINGWKYDISVLDRIYYSHDFIIKLINDYAKLIGVTLRRSVNGSGYSRSFNVLNTPNERDLEDGNETELTIRINTPASKWHKRGVPYLDTFTFLHFGPDFQFYLSNEKKSNQFLAHCQSTGGIADRYNTICPRCGKIHNDDTDPFCEDCESDVKIPTLFGNIIKSNTKSYRGEIYPSFLFERGRPTPYLNAFLTTQKLY